MKKLLIVLACVPLSLFSAPVEFWGCKFAEGYSMDDLNKWVVKWNKVIDGLDDQSYSAYIMTPGFTDNLGAVDFVWAGTWDSYASMGNGFEEYFGSGGKGLEIHKEFEQITNCSSHTLVDSRQVREASN